MRQLDDLVIEVLSKNKKRDKKIKFEDYEEHGVIEYWIINAQGKTVAQYILKNKKYSLKLETDVGMIESKTVKGFKIPIKAIFDKKENIKALTNILAQ